MAYSDRNMCNTVESQPRWQTLPCAVPHRKVTALYHRLAAEDGDESRIWDTCHQWTDHNGGTFGGTCIHCGKTLKEVRVRVNPKTGEPVRRGGIAREIAQAVRDVAPVRFIDKGQP